MRTPYLDPRTRRRRTLSRARAVTAAVAGGSVVGAVALADVEAHTDTGRSGIAHTAEAAGVPATTTHGTATPDSTTPNAAPTTTAPVATAPTTTPATTPTTAATPPTSTTAAPAPTYSAPAATTSPAPVRSGAS